MIRFRGNVLALLSLIFLVIPVLLPILTTFRSPDAWLAWSEADRIVALAGTTASLAALACLVAVPAGTFLAVALVRIPFAGRRSLRCLVLVGLFVPLPVYAVAWQIVFGAWLPPLALDPGRVAWRPWTVGLLPAAWVHGMAGLPWVVWIVGAGLRTTDRGLEEDATLLQGTWGVLRRVLLPRAALAATVAAGWVAAQATTEIPVTDAMMVRTFAEEAYTRYVSGGVGLASAVAVTLPVWVVATLAAAIAARSAVRRFGNPPSDSGMPRILAIGRGGRWGVTIAAWSAAGLFAGLPLTALFWKAGDGGTRDGWAPSAIVGQISKVARSDGAILAHSATAAVAGGMLAAGWAWGACWAASRSPTCARALFVACIVLWLTPGPVVGFGLLDAIGYLLDGEDAFLSWLGVAAEFPLLRSILYDQPSAVPGVWATLVRFFPVAVAVIWPTIRGIPTNLLDAARLDGFGTAGMWRLVVVPLSGAAWVRATVAVAALAMGEVSASKVVNPPGHTTFILQVFDQMHYGSESTVAGLCLLQIAAMALIGGVMLCLTTARR